MFWWKIPLGANAKKMCARKPIRDFFISMKASIRGSMFRGNQMVGQIDRLQLNAIQR